MLMKEIMNGPHHTSFTEANKKPHYVIGKHFYTF